MVMTIDFCFTDEHRSLINGSLLGDGYLTKPKYGNSAFTKNQCVAHYDYLLWHHEVMGDLSSSLIKSSTNAEGKQYWRHRFSTRSHPWFTEARRKWYPEGKKIIPHDLVLDPLTVAVWFFDDGSNVLSSRLVSFATHCFSSEEVDFLGSRLAGLFGFKWYRNSDGVLRIKPESYKAFVDLVKPYMKWPCFDHKVVYRDSELRMVREEDVPKLVEWYKEGKTMSWIADEIGTSISSVSSILRGNRKKFVGVASPGLPLNNKSGVKGVCWDRRREKWVVSVKHYGKTYNLGRYDTKEEAAQVRLGWKPPERLPEDIGI
jgi:hypothetical protein